MPERTHQEQQSSCERFTGERERRPERGNSWTNGEERWGIPVTRAASWGAGLRISPWVKRPLELPQPQPTKPGPLSTGYEGRGGSAELSLDKGAQTIYHLVRDSPNLDKF